MTPASGPRRGGGRPSVGQAVGPAGHGGDDRYRWVALANTTAAMFMAGLDGSIVIIAMPSIFRGINLDPLALGNVGYLLWMIMGYSLVQAVLVVTLGRLGDMFGRIRIYNAGFVVFTIASILLSFDPFDGGHGALWLIGWRMLQAVGGSMLMANSAAILTDAFPVDRRGFALGINQVAFLAGQFVGLVAGGVLAALDWRAVFWVNVPVGVFGTLWAYRKLRETGHRGEGGRLDWWGNITFAVGLGMILVAITKGIQPYRDHTMGWLNPTVIAMITSGVLLLVAFVVIERRAAEPMFELALFRVRAFIAGSMAGLAVSVARGGLQFMLIIWLQGIWLPLHGFDYHDTPFWAGIYLLPLTVGVIVAGPVSGFLSDRVGARGLASAGMLVFASSFVGLTLLPVDFPYWAFALLIAANGVGGGMFSAPNSSSIMGSVPASQRGAASGMRSTFQNAGTTLSIGVFFSLMIVGLASSLPEALTSGLQQQGVPPDTARGIADLPPVSSLFATVLGANPIEHLLTSTGGLSTLSPEHQQTLTGREFFPNLISEPFHRGLVVVFVTAAVLALLAACASLLRGGRPPQPVPAGQIPLPSTEPSPSGASAAGGGLPVGVPSAPSTSSASSKSQASSKSSARSAPPTRPASPVPGECGPGADGG
ncbi:MULTISPECIES: MFS transporter [Protofrankia]|uniref:MFS transporter n=1 Tax=Protofrankia coriariae TaxID=1562887 RepID=A0ABR5F0U4_9ACTN|nr:MULTISPECIES: MFS transporter [Protofrankia]KLL10329.1 MFS transporter [Protofrankia coriariae]ONH34525.1 MFS transporter [Protofrankia sp. BMG5.30]